MLIILEDLEGLQGLEVLAIPDRDQDHLEGLEGHRDRLEDRVLPVGPPHPFVLVDLRHLEDLKDQEGHLDQKGLRDLGGLEGLEGLEHL